MSLEFVQVIFMFMKKESFGVPLCTLSRFVRRWFQHDLLSEHNSSETKNTARAVSVKINLPKPEASAQLVLYKATCYVYMKTGRQHIASLMLPLFPRHSNG